MKKFSGVSRISKTAVHFFACVVEEMIRKIVKVSLAEMITREEQEMQMEHIFHAFHQEKSFLVLLE